MKTREKTLYQANEFSELTGVTVRALHHYDELGLLRPKRSDAKYRLYGEAEFAKLQQIVLLKYIGLSLKEIKVLLGQSEFDLLSTLLIQKRVIQSQKKKLDSIDRAIERAFQALQTEENPNWNLFKKIVEEIEREDKMEWVKKYYTQEQLDELSKRWDPALQDQITKDWNALFQEAEALAKTMEDPSSPKAQDLAERWEKMVGAFTGGQPDIEESLAVLHQDKDNWPEDMKKMWRSSLSQGAEGFINKAREVWTQKNMT